MYVSRQLTVGRTTWSNYFYMSMCGQRDVSFDCCTVDPNFEYMRYEREVSDGTTEIAQEVIATSKFGIIDLNHEDIRTLPTRSATWNCCHKSSAFSNALDSVRHPVILHCSRSSSFINSSRAVVCFPSIYDLTLELIEARKILCWYPQRIHMHHLLE